MNKKLLLRKLKKHLTLIGTRISPLAFHHLQMILNYMKLGRWMIDNHFEITQRLPNRIAVFDAVANRVFDKRVLYLEFGVYQGASMRYWSKALKNNDARLHGFDSFEGLPEDFDDAGGRYRKGDFNVEGKLPLINDSRVEFFKGWFDQVLPHYNPPEYDVLVITMDADLYSSTIYVLRHLRPHIKQGTFIYFDDMSRPDHEPRAFCEFMDESGLKFELIATDESLNTVFFECIA